MGTPVTDEASETRFKRWRLANGLSLQDVADLAGIDKSMVSRLDGGSRGLKPLTKVRVARRLGARVADLFEVEPLEGAGQE
jgi:transcriptional regulator with XRE-family HTH domain